SIGTWLLSVTVVVSVVYAYTFLRDAPGLPNEMRYPLRRKLSSLAVPLGIATAVYTGILLGAMPSRPFWNSPIVALLFLVSALSTGIAGTLLIRALFHASNPDPETGKNFSRSGYLLTAADVLLIGFELMIIFLFIMYAHLTIGSVKEAVSVILFGGDLAPLFWLGVVVIGLLIPALVESIYIVPKLLYHRDFSVPRGVEVVVPAVILVGGFMLRYVVVVAGQITGPVGI
ncbi:MAG: polysulfide reductase NrfD, partial [Rhodospirillales bacterium]|nr:polysulfide reductase NrfD [Rhodospirillales bacterium]